MRSCIDQAMLDLAGMEVVYQIGRRMFTPVDVAAIDQLHFSELEQIEFVGVAEKNDLIFT